MSATESSPSEPRSTNPEGLSADELARMLRNAAEPAAAILKKAKLLSKRKHAFFDTLRNRRRALEGMYSCIPLYAWDPSNDPFPPFTWEFEEFLESAELEAASPDCVGGILAFGYLGEGCMGTCRESLQGLYDAGGLGPFGKFTLALAYLYGDEALGHIDIERARDLLAESAESGSRASAALLMKLYRATPWVRLPRLDGKTEADGEGADSILSNEELSALRDAIENPADIGRVEVSAMPEGDAERQLLLQGKRRVRFGDEGEALRLALRFDPGWDPDSGSYCVDSLWDGGRYTEALALLDRFVVMGHEWALNDALGIAMRIVVGAAGEPEEALAACRGFAGKGIFKSALVLAAMKPRLYDNVVKLASSRGLGPGFDDDPAFAMCLVEQAEMAKREYESPADGGALSQKDIDSLLAGLGKR